MVCFSVYQSTPRPPQTLWRAAQFALAALGVALIAALFVSPTIGLHAFWDALIPAAPLLFVFAPGLWRNICPLASCALLPRHLNKSKKKRLSSKAVNKLQRLSLVALLVIIPLRHPLFNLDGSQTAAMLIAFLAIALLVGSLSEWKSAWCAAACPIHHVEKLYGCQTAITFNNAHCFPCAQCVEPCPDSTRNNHALYPGLPRHRLTTGKIMAGIFPGYVWGWFQVADNAEGLNVYSSYQMCLLGGAVTLALFQVALKTRRDENDFLLAKFFAGAAVAAYYWYRLPALIGFTKFASDGTLVDLSSSLPIFTPTILRIATTSLFIWWFLVRKSQYREWLRRPIVQK
jgi:hypothetical protein